VATKINVHDAKTNLSKLLARVESGEEFIIARGGKPVARLGRIPVEHKTKPKRNLGFAEGLWTKEDIEAMLDPRLHQEIVASFYEDNLIPDEHENPD
jgi:prevent-host-death family protein